ncbi:MAG: efflux RND transporter permease subunit, partial [Pseudomonas bubulae]
MNGKFNLSEWALKHQSFVWYLMFVAVVAGIFSYINLGRAEDPSFAIKTMVIQSKWPGATVDETRLQITDRIEKKLEELDSLDYVQSYTRPGESTVFVFLKDTTKADAIPHIWYEVRKKIGDIRGDFPQGIQGPGFDDEFGDVYGTIFAFTGDGFTMRQLRDYVEQVRTGIRDVPNRGKVMTIGEQDETFYLDFSTRKLAALGLDQQHILESLQEQNAVTPAGVIEAGPERMSVRTSGQFHSVEDLAAVNLRVNDRFYRLADIAEITRG